MAETRVKRPPERVVAIETGSPRGTVAAAGAAGVCQQSLDDGGRHGQLLSAALDAVATAAGFRAAETDLVVVVRGPGSFTGLRVGVTLAKSLAWAVGARLVGVRGEELVARRVAPRGAETVWVVFAAGRGEVAVTRVAPTPETPTGWCCGPRELWVPEALVAALPPRALLAGPGAAGLGGLRPGHDRPVDDDFGWPTAAEALDAGRGLAAAGVEEDPAGLVPDYLRPSYAEEPRRG